MVMRWQMTVAIAGMLLVGPSALAQVQQPIASRTVLKGAISDRRAAELSGIFRERASVREILVDPERVRAGAGVVDRPPVVIDTGGVVAPVPQPAPTPPPATVPARPRLEIVRTTAAEENILRGAIANQSGLQSALMVKDSSLITLPGLVRMDDGNAEPLQLKPFILVSAPLRRTANGSYEGQLLIGVSEIVDRAVTRMLPTPLAFQIVGAARSDPSTVLVESTSPPFKEVNVTLRNLRGGTPEVQIFSVIDRAGTRIALPVEGELSIEADSGSIEGLGLAKTRLHVAVTGVADPAGRRVSLQVAPSGFLDDNVLVLGADGTADTGLRSDGVGTARIRVSLAGFEPASTSIDFRMPLLTFGAAIAGGFLGAFISFATASRRKKRVWLRLVGAALFGVLVFALYVVGINLLPIKPEVTVGTAFVFATAAFAAWLGPTIADWKKKLPVPAAAAGGG